MKMKIHIVNSNYSNIIISTSLKFKHKEKSTDFYYIENAPFMTQILEFIFGIKILIIFMHFNLTSLCWMAENRYWWKLHISCWKIIVLCKCSLLFCYIRSNTHIYASSCVFFMLKCRENFCNVDFQWKSTWYLYFCINTFYEKKSSSFDWYFERMRIREKKWRCDRQKDRKSNGIIK